MQTVASFNEYNQTYDTGLLETTIASDGTAFAFLITVFIVFFIIAIVFYVINSLLLGLVFQKAGVASWKAWVPILNGWKLLEIGGQQGFWAVLAIVPVVNVISTVFVIIAMHNINLKLNYNIGMTVLAVFLPLIWLVVLAITKNPWNDSLGAPRIDMPDVVPINNQPPPTVTSEAIDTPIATSEDKPAEPIQEPDVVESEIIGVDNAEEDEKLGTEQEDQPERSDSANNERTRESGITRDRYQPPRPRS